MTSLQTTQAYQVTYDYGKEGALVDALLGGDVPERRTARKRRAAANDRSPFKSANVFGF